VCVHCSYHFRLGAYDRLEKLFDDAHCEELDSEVVSTDPLEFVDSKPYTKRIAQAQAATGLPEAVITARGKVGGHRVFAGAMDMNFIGGSMGSAVGEKLTRLIEQAIKERGAVIIFAASGGARMQEGILSLMQLPKTVCAVEDLRDARCGFISVMSHPTTAGVLASFASLGDVIVAEPGALLAFTGPRVVQQTTREKLPDDFGLAESNLRFGHLDAIVPRTELRSFLARTLRLFHNGR